MKTKLKKLEIITLISIIMLIAPIESSDLLFLFLWLAAACAGSPALNLLMYDSCDADDAAITDLFDQIQECFRAKNDLNKIIKQQNEDIAKMKADILQTINEQNANLMETITKQNEKTEAIYNMMSELFAKHKVNEQNEELILQIEQLKLQKSESDNYKENNQKLLVQIEEIKQKKSESEVIMNNYKEEKAKLLLEVQEQRKQIAQYKENQKKCNEKNEKLKKPLGLIKTFEELDDEISQNKPIVIQRRIDGSVDFARTWHEYKMGFGNSSSEFFIGLETLYKLTNNRSYTLRIEMEDWENERRYAEYNHFMIDNEIQKYELSCLGQYSGNAGNSLEYHLGEKFSTKDKDNDSWEDVNCSLIYGGGGGWWFSNDWGYSNLNGPYKKDGQEANSLGEVILWNDFKGFFYSLKFVEMTLRPN